MIGCINVKSIVIGLIVEKIAEVDTIREEDIVPPPSLSRSSSEQNKYVYGLAKTEDTMKLLIDPEKLIKEEDMEDLEAMEELKSEEE